MVENNCKNPLCIDGKIYVPLENGKISEDNFEQCPDCGEKPDNNIRQAFEKIYKIPENVEWVFGNYHEKKPHEWGDYALTKESNEYAEKYQIYYLGSKSRQKEIDCLKHDLKEYIKVSEEIVESMKCCGNCGNNKNGSYCTDYGSTNHPDICDNWKKDTTCPTG